MSKEQIHFKFNIGSLAVTVEAGSGYGAPELLDHVSLSVRSLSEKGRPGARQAVAFGVTRNEIAGIGLAFLDVARGMAPETTWARSSTVAGKGQPHRVLPLTVVENQALEKFQNEVGVDFLRSKITSFDKLQKRIHILQRVQHLLESVDDSTAGQLDVLTTVLETVGKLPFQLGLTVVPPEEVEKIMKESTGASSAQKH